MKVLRRLLVLLALAAIALLVLLRRGPAHPRAGGRPAAAMPDVAWPPRPGTGTPPTNRAPGHHPTSTAPDNLQGTARAAVGTGPVTEVTIARPGHGRSWMPPEDGACPPGFPVKVSRSGIYHVPGGTLYQRTVPERCYTTAAAAEADGYRASKR